MKTRMKIVTLVVAVIIFSAVLCVDATTTEFDAPYDTGDSDYDFGGSALHYPGDGRNDASVSAPGFEVNAWSWIGSDIDFGSTKSVSMDADLRLKAYIYADGLWGAARVRIYLECRKYSDITDVVWSVKVFDFPCDTNEDYEWDYDELALNLNNFPVSTPTGRYYFVVMIDVIGSWGGYFQYSDSSSIRARLVVDSITVTY